MNLRCTQTIRRLALRVCALAYCASASMAHAHVPKALPVSGDVQFTHDPSIAQNGKTYYTFAMGKAPDGGQFPVRCSED